MDILTFPKVPFKNLFSVLPEKIKNKNTFMCSSTVLLQVTWKYRCIVRVIAAYPWQVEDFYSDENRRHRVVLTLEDPTATLEAFLCDKDAVNTRIWSICTEIVFYTFPNLRVNVLAGILLGFSVSGRRDVEEETESVARNKGKLQLGVGFKKSTMDWVLYPLLLYS